MQWHMFTKSILSNPSDFVNRMLPWARLHKSLSLSTRVLNSAFNWVPHHSISWMLWTSGSCLKLSAYTSRQIYYMKDVSPAPAHLDSCLGSSTLLNCCCCTLTWNLRLFSVELLGEKLRMTKRGARYPGRVFVYSAVKGSLGKMTKNHF